MVIETIRKTVAWFRERIPTSKPPVPTSVESIPIVPVDPRFPKMEYQGALDTESVRKAIIASRRESPRDSPIQWHKFLPDHATLFDYINRLMANGVSDKSIIRYCVLHATKHGHPDTFRIRQKIRSSLRSVRCVRLRGRSFTHMVAMDSTSTSGGSP